MKPYAFFLDLDGTLVSGGVVPGENMDAIKEAQKRGHFVLINTGRSYAGIEKEILNSADFDGVVAALGADIRIHGEQVYLKRLSFDVAETLVDLFCAIPEQNLYLSGENALFVTNPKFASDQHIVIRSLDEYRKLYAHEPVNKFTATIQPDKDALGIIVSECNLYYHAQALEGTVAGCSKATGMAIAAEKLGVPMERCVAIGDGKNDVDVLSSAGIAVVMGNHDDGMEQYADFITDTAENAGVGKAILKLIEEN